MTKITWKVSIFYWVNERYPFVVCLFRLIINFSHWFFCSMYISWFVNSSLFLLITFFWSDFRKVKISKNLMLLCISFRKKIFKRILFLKTFLIFAHLQNFLHKSWYLKSMICKFQKFTEFIFFRIHLTEFWKILQFNKYINLDSPILI